METIYLAGAVLVTWIALGSVVAIGIGKAVQYATNKEAGRYL